MHPSTGEPPEQPQDSARPDPPARDAEPIRSRHDPSAPPEPPPGDPDQPVDAAESSGLIHDDVGGPFASVDRTVPDQACRPDPWAHRRGEPRVFALLWTVYLFTITALVFFTAMAGPSISPEVMRPAARVVLLLTAMGIALLWPMVRLSQLPDLQPLRGALQDLLVVMIPAQALIWPQVLWWLARWPFSTVAALSLSLAAWGVLIAGLIAMAQVSTAAGPHRPLRSLSWMMVFIVMAGGGLLVSALEGRLAAAPSPGDVRAFSADVALMFSPLGAVLELTRDVSWSGRSTPLSRLHWGTIALVAVAAATVWARAALRSRRLRVGLRLNT